MRKELIEEFSKTQLEKAPSRGWLWAIFCIIIFIFVAGMASAFLPAQFTIKSIVVENTRPDVAQEIKLYVQDVVQKKAQIFGRTSIFLIPRDLLEYELPNKFPIIKTVQILRELPSTVKIIVQEKVSVAVLQSGGSSYSLDPNGVAFEKISDDRMKKNTYPVISDERKTANIEVGRSVVDAATIYMMHNIARLLPERFALNIDSITIPAIGSQELHVHTSEGWVLVLDSSRSLDEQFAVLEKVFAEQISNARRLALSYVDLRAPGKAFFKFKDGL